MKQKVISYKKDGNSIKQGYMELEQKSAHVYTSNRKDSVFGVDLNLVFEVNGVYFMNGHCTKETLLKEGNLDKAEQFAVNYMQGVMDDQAAYPNLLMLEVFRQAGTKEQVELLINRRKEILQRREEKERQYFEKRKREKEEASRLHEEEYQDAVRKFLNGEYVQPGYVVEMLRRSAIKVHPRTLCNLQNHCSEVSTGSIRIRNKKRSYNGVFTAVKELRQKLTLQPNKS